jgi:hypothetical protein
VKKKTRKALKYGLATTLVGQVVIPTVVLAEDINNSSTDEEEQEINLQIAQQKDIDVVLTVGNTSVDPKTFETDLLKELEERNIDVSRVNIEAVETQSFSTNDANAEEIFNTWKNYPDNAGQWAYHPETNSLGSTQNVHWTGFWDDSLEAQSTTDVEIEYDFREKYTIGTSHPDPQGFTFRMTQKNGLYSFYAFWYYQYEGRVALFKAENLTEQEVRNAVPIAFTSILGNQTSFVNGKVKVLATAYWGPSGFNAPNDRQWKHVKISAKGDHIQVYMNGSKVIDVHDSSLPRGSYGPFTYSMPNADLANITITKQSAKTFGELIRQPEWRNNAKHFVVNLEDNEVSDFDDPRKSGEILTRLMNEEINYVGWGTNKNKEQAEEFIQKNGGNGKFIDNSDYAKSLDELADYIVQELNKDVKEVTAEDPYVLVGAPVKISTSPKELQSNTETPEYPNGRWKIDHNKDYFDNNEGLSALSNGYRSSLPTSFDKPGEYELWFEDKHPNPRYIYAHRRPIANFAMTYNKTSEGITVTMEDLSYDIDNQNDEDKGIAERKWRWKETTATTWNDGQLPPNLPEGKHYLVQLQVKDHQGVWSVPVTAYVTTDTSVETTPIANFTLLNDTVIIENELEINDSSYDPAGKPLTTKEWKVYKGKELVYAGATPIKDFSSYGLGEYTIQLTVTNSDGIKSEPFSRSVKVVEKEYIEAMGNIDEINHNLENISSKEGLENLKELANQTEELINGLQEGEDKERARSEFDKVNQLIEAASKVQEVKDTTENLYTESAIQQAKNLHSEALSLVNALPEGDIKGQLLQKLDDYLSIITQAENNLIHAELVNEKDVSLSWLPYEGANSYRVYIYKLNPTTGEYEEYSFPRAAYGETLEITGLESGHTYMFEVYPRKNGVEITEEPIGSAAIDIPVPEPEPIPTVQNVSVTVNGTEATVTWDKLEEALRYRVQTYVKDPTTGEFVKEGFGRTTVSNSIVMKNLGEGKTYKFEIIPNIEYTYIEEAAGVSSEVTIGSVVEEEPVVESSLTVTIDGTTARLSWEPIEDATRYRVQRYIKDEDTGLFVKDGYAKAITDTEITFDDLKPGTEYKFEVTPRVGWIYDSNYAISTTAKTEVVEKEKPVVEATLNVTLDGTTAHLTWDTIEDATRYRVQKYIKNEETGEFVQDNYAKTVNGTELSFTDLVEGAEYKFEVVPLIGYMYDYDYAITKIIQVESLDEE